MGCNSTRIRKDYGRQMCKAHGREAGGCADPAHMVSQSIAISFMVACHSVEIRSWCAECALAAGDVESSVGDLMWVVSSQIL